MTKEKEMRKDFPILSGGGVYLDSGASTLTPRQVVEAMDEYYREYRANIHRGVYCFSRKASEAYDSSREKVASFIGAKPEELVYTKGTTESINAVALSLLFSKDRKRKKIITTALEHHSNLLPWQRLTEHGFRLEVIWPDREGFLDPEAFREKVDKDTALVAVTHASNVMGSIQPVEEIGRICRDRGARFLIDGAQSAPHIPVDVSRISCDFFCFSAHKMLGPTGVGALYAREGSGLEPAYVGGGIVEDVEADSYSLTGRPARFEAGTPNIAGAIGFGAAVDYLKKTGLDWIESHEARLLERMHSGLSALDGVKMYYSGLENRIGVVPFNLEGLGSHEAAKLLDGKGYMVRSGHHCALPLMKGVLGARECLRASLYLYNTLEEVEGFVSSVGEILGK